MLVSPTRKRGPHKPDARAREQRDFPVDTDALSGIGYRLEALVGRNRSEIWRAIAPNGSTVAVKIYPAFAEAEQRLHVERILTCSQQCRCPFLLQTRRWYIEEDRLYVVLELADGNLRDRLNQCREKGLSGVPVEE